ncbi:MAG TPA: hypothetical protein VNP02_08640, partial [Gammaproteobacteria bacterium]|nr:hypothetical protein [Gammaproteobacteria bacterium]
MNRWIGLLNRTAAGFLAASALSISVTGQAPSDEEKQLLEEIAVTGMRVTAGGARDAKFARAEVVEGRIP